MSSGLGAQRVCHFQDGNQIMEDITAYTPGREYEVEIIDPGNFPLKRAVARLAVEPLADERSRVSFHMAFRPRFGPVGWVMGKTVMTTQFTKILGRVLAGLEEHAKTGEVVGGKKAAAA